MPFAIAAGITAGAGIAAGAAVTAGAVVSIAAGVAVTAGLVMTVVGAATGDKGLMKIGGLVGLAGGLVGGAASLGADAAAGAADTAGAAAASQAVDPASLQAASAAAQSGDPAAVSNLQSVADQASTNANTAYDAGYQSSINNSTLGTGTAGINNTANPASVALGGKPAVQTIGSSSAVSTPNTNQSWLDFMKAPSSNGTAIAQIASGALQGLNQQNNLQTQNQLTAQNQNYQQYVQNTMLRNANSPGGLNLTVAPVDPASAQAYKLAQAQLSANQAGLLAKG